MLNISNKHLRATLESTIDQHFKTNIKFLPSKEIFSSTKFSSTVLQKRMRELAFLNKGIGLTLTDKTSSKIKKYENKFDGRILEFVQYINQKKPI